MRNQLFNRNHIQLESLSKRHHKLTRDHIQSLCPIESERIHEDFYPIAKAIKDAVNYQSSVILMMGAHVIRSGVQRYIIDLMKNGYISCIAMNGAGVIHDFEFSLIGATTESVAHYIQDGHFGFWNETGKINDIVVQAAKNQMGLGEAVGQYIFDNKLPYQDISLLAAGVQFNIPITVHVGIGYDIIHQFPNCDGAAYGTASYQDFLKFAHIMASLENGVVMNFGSAVMGPEIFLKALSMVRNVARQNQQKISHFTTLVCDLIQLPKNIHQEPDSSNPYYYFRPWKTMLVRTVADGGQSFYIQGNHAQTIPSLWTSINQMD